MVKAFTHGAMGHQINPSWGGPIELFLVPANWCNKGSGMCYPVCEMVHIKERVAYVAAVGFLSLSEWSFTICPTPYNRKIKCVECVIK